MHGGLGWLSLRASWRHRREEDQGLGGKGGLKMRTLG
jgi:hypothetical protein